MRWIEAAFRAPQGKLDALCDDLELDRDDLERRLSALGLAYDAAHNRVD